MTFLSHIVRYQNTTEKRQNQGQQHVKGLFIYIYSSLHTEGDMKNV